MSTANSGSMQDQSGSDVSPIQSSDGAISESPKSHPTGNAVKDPETWVTKDEPMTGAQASYLQTLSEEAGKSFDANLTKAQASEMIDQLQKETGRGQSQH